MAAIRMDIDQTHIRTPNNIWVPRRETAVAMVRGSAEFRGYFVDSGDMDKRGAYQETDGKKVLVAGYLTRNIPAIGLAGPPGVGKTTLVYTLAYEMGMPLVRVPPEAAVHDVIGQLPNENNVFDDSRVTALVRSGMRGVVLFDDGIRLDQRVFSVLGSAMDTNRELGTRAMELLDSGQITCIFTWNSPDPMEKGMGGVMPAYILNRMPVIRFETPDGKVALGIVRAKHAGDSEVQKVITRYEAALVGLYNDLNNTDYLTANAPHITTRFTTRELEALVLTLASGVAPEVAVAVEVANPMFDVECSAAASLRAAVVADAVGKGLKP